MGKVHLSILHFAFMHFASKAFNHQNPKNFVSKGHFCCCCFIQDLSNAWTMDIDRGKCENVNSVSNTVSSANRNSANILAVLITLIKTICNVEHCLYFAAAGQECKYAVAGKNQQ